MSGNALFASDSRLKNNRLGDLSSVSLLAVGEPGLWEELGRSPPNGPIAIVGFSEVTASTLEYFTPSVIVSPVLAPTFDCIELATLLHHLGYSGAYRAVSNSLPNPGLIEREVREICGRLDFRIVKSH